LIPAMIDGAAHRLIQALHDAPGKCVLAVTGGGTQAAAMLLNVPGGSRTILEVLVPYAERSLDEFLGHRPEQACSAATSVAMARRALERARWLAPGEAVVGVGCTASLATDRPKRGDHRFHLAVHDARRVRTYSLTLTKGARAREGEEAILDAVLLNALAEAFGIEARLPAPLLGDEAVAQEVQATGGLLARLLQGDVARVCMEVDGRLRTDAAPPKLLLPGSFNPLHEGHCRLAAVASQMTGQPAGFELSVTNVDKPALEIEEIQRRLIRFCWQVPVWLTRAPTFAEKAQLFPGIVFVVGADTAVRIVEVKYYHDDEARMAAALEQIRSQGCRFLVAGRVEQSGRFVGLDELAIPAAYRDLFVEIPEAAFRCDISSTQLRQSTVQ
jgi:hypothetical protein